MKRILFVLCNLLLAHILCAGIHTYTSHSVLKDGNAMKVRISETGVHAISYDTLQAWGFNPDSVRVLGYGGAMLSENFSQAHHDDLPSVAFYMHKGDDGKFGKGDYILFFAQGVTKWHMRTNGTWAHTRNPYSKYGYYFISDTAGKQRIIATADANNAASDINTIDVDWYMYHDVHEEDSINLVDRNGVNGGGREFYGEQITSRMHTREISFPTSNVRTNKEATCRVNLAGTTGEATKISVNYGSNSATSTIPAINVSDFYTKAEMDSVTLIAKPTTTGAQKVKLQFVSGPQTADVRLNFVALSVPCDLIMTGDAILITNTAHLGEYPYIRFSMRGASAQTQIWRITDGVNIEQMPTQLTNGVITWVGNNTSAERYIAINPSTNNWKNVKSVGKVTPQDLHKLENIDYVIICPTDFVAPATRLAEKHEEVDGLTWAVVTDEQVYNEFSSGTPDATAYRWLMKMLYDRANGDKNRQPKSLLLMGDGTFDNRSLLPRSGTNTLLTYQAKNSTVETMAYATDDYFGFMSDNAGVSNGEFNDVRATMNLGVGRLPVNTIEQANAVVDKLCTYMDDLILGKWKSQILFLADDGDHGLHVQTADGGAERLRKKNPDFIVNKIYLDAYTQEVSAAGESYPLAKNQYDNLMSNGVMFMNYSGHGGYNNITSELFMRLADIQKMTNANQGFWFMATCSFAHFDSGVTSAAEEAVLNPHGGAIGVLAACRTVYATQNTILNRNLCDTLFGHKNVYNYNMTLGEATRIAKNMTGRDSNKMPYILLGDPALKLNTPTDYQVKTSTALDTLNALSVQSVKGYIQTEDGDTATWFNGKLDVTILDKMQQITTRDNDEPKEQNKVKITYNDYPNTLFAGKTDVIDGKFEFTFMVPKDIRYNYGAGRIVYYAYDEENREEAVGHYEDFVVGGSSTVITQDTVGPDLHIYLNNPAFMDGDATYEFPHFYADIYDENGINTVGTGIGHDLLMIVDADPKQTFVLNDYFAASNNSYQQGQVSYRMQEQTEGMHTLTFRAWDLHNNSSTAALNFQVVKGMDPQIYKVVTYPNPVASTENLTIQVEYDQPDEVVQTTINMYDISGKLILTHEQKSTNGIRWNLSSLNVSPGIYVYQVKIKTTTSNYVSKAGKIIVTQ
jgi:hypothetical protein